VITPALTPRSARQGREHGGGEEKGEEGVVESGGVGGDLALLCAFVGACTVGGGEGGCNYGRIAARPRPRLRRDRWPIRRNCLSISGSSGRPSRPSWADCCGRGCYSRRRPGWPMAIHLAVRRLWPLRRQQSKRAGRPGAIAWTAVRRRLLRVVHCRSCAGLAGRTRCVGWVDSVRRGRAVVASSGLWRRATPRWCPAPGVAVAVAVAETDRLLVRGAPSPARSR